MGWVLALAGIAAAEVFTFDPIAGVRSVVLTIDSNHLQDNAWVGAREIGFEGVAGEPAFIQPDAGSTDGGTFNKTDYAVENLWNEGVTAGTDTIDANAPNAGNGFASANPPLAGYPVSITLEFTTAQELSAFYLWNASGGGLSGPPSHGIKQFDLEFFDGTGKSLGTLTDLQAAQAPHAGNYPVERVDPRFPAERLSIPREDMALWPRTRIQQLEAERERLLERISALPQHDPKLMTSHLGYHSPFDEPASDGMLPSHQIDFTLTSSILLDSIALAPAFNPQEFGAYAFPKRFKIEVLNARTASFETVVDWTQEDFPDPGPYPVFFAGINRRASQVRITVLQVERESGVAYYALGEIYLFQHRKDGRIGANAAEWEKGITLTVAPDSLMLPALWDVEYLHDGVVGFGPPLSDETVASEDLIVTYGNEDPVPDKVQIVLDLGQARSVGRIDFWSAAAPHQLVLPSFGFPKNILVEMSANPDFKPAKELKVDNAGKRMYSGYLLPVIGEGYQAQYIRVTMGELDKYKGNWVLGMGEILVTQNENVFSINCKVTAEGIPTEYLGQLARLVDGCSRNRRILPQGEWIKGLAQRRPLDRRLAVVERELEHARTAWRRIQLRSSVWIGGVICMLLVGGLLFQQRQRRRGLENLKWRITRDLHDELGSSLGSISLAAKRLENDGQHPDEKGDLADLSLLAREASVSLREVVWVIDQSVIRLPELIQKLVERAERVLYGVELSVEIPVDCPNRVVPLTFKRHLIMFFREVVYNCARHANATRAKISVSIEAEQLRVEFSDNGYGFDPAAQRDGWGLASMKKRAQELGGEMELNSRVGEGTTVVLKIPLEAL
ncbi:MAG: hypothetical protein KAU94_11580, partial [Verrucomicrobia bacterium]|nr:hypothetical protein [Verrucomicrobiota bacterium]